jgi:hypothetical protein
LGVSETCQHNLTEPASFKINNKKIRRTTIYKDDTPNLKQSSKKIKATGGGRTRSKTPAEKSCLHCLSTPPEKEPAEALLAQEIFFSIFHKLQTLQRFH